MLGSGNDVVQATLPRRGENTIQWGGKRGPTHDKERIKASLHAKTRTIGIDTDALDAMVQRHQQDEVEEKLAARSEREQLDALTIMQAERESEEMALEFEERRNLVNDWRYQKNARSRVEADLNPKFNPSQPIDAENCGPGAAQHFAGLDADFKGRTRFQQQQFKKWCQQESDRKLELTNLRQSQSQAEAERMNQIDSIRKSAEEAALLEEQQQRYAIQDYNKLLAKEARAKKRQEELYQKQIDQWELQNQFNDPVLAEDPNLGYVASGRVRKDQWKGMSQEEVSAIYKHNALQMEEMRQKQQAEKEELMQHSAMLDELDKSLIQMEQTEAGNQIAERFELRKDHDFQKADHRAREKARNRELGQGAVGDGFHSQFGCS
jgi:hypothetical protein